jgi:hypothetical protein
MDTSDVAPSLVLLAALRFNSDGRRFLFKTLFPCIPQFIKNTP